MTEIEGVVSGIFNKDFHDVKLWSFKIEGSDRFYNMGQKQPTFEEGQCVKFTERNNRVDWNSIETISKDALKSTTAPSENSTTAAGTINTSDVGDRIRYQAARHDATLLVTAALKTDHLPHASNVAKGKRLDLLLGYIKQVTQQLLEQENDQ